MTFLHQGMEERTREDTYGRPREKEIIEVMGCFLVKDLHGNYNNPGYYQDNRLLSTNCQQGHIAENNMHAIL